MSWFLIALIGYFILAGVSVSDKFILSKKLTTPAVFVFYSTFFLLLIFLTLFFTGGFLVGFDWWWAVFSGVTVSLGFWAMYKGFLKSEVSHAGPMLGAAIPFFVLLISVGFLNEFLTEKQLWGCVFLMLGSLLISFEKSKMHNGWHRGFLWIILAGFLFAVSHISAKYLYDVYDFSTGLIWTRGFSGLFGVVLILLPSVRREIYSWFQKKQNTETENKVFKNRFGLIAFNKIFGVVGVLLIQFATAIGSVTIVNAMSGVQFGLLVIIVAVLSRFYPKILKEEYSKLEIVQEVIAVVVIGVGLGMLI